MRRRLLPSSFAALLLAPCLAYGQTHENPSPAVAAPTEVEVSAPIELELNKLEQNQGACRAYFVVNNGTEQALKELSLDVFVFSREEVITSRVGLSFTDVRPDRRKVVLFDLDATPCDEVGELLVNDVLSCEAEAGGQMADCRKSITTSSRATATFAY